MSNLTKENILEILKDMSKITNAINDNVDLNILHDSPRTDVLLEVMITKKHKNLFNTILKKGFPNKNNKFFHYTHKAVLTNDLYFVKKIFEHYEQYGLDIFELDEHQNNTLHTAFRMTDKNMEIIDYLINKGISLNDKNKEGLTPKDLM